MKIQFFSDIHLECFKKNHIRINNITDILILGGDIGRICDSNYKNFIKDCSKRWKYILVILGNHEYHHKKKCMKVLNDEYNEYFNNFSNVYLLDNNFIVIDGWKFIGSTLWSYPNKYLIDDILDFKKIHIERNKCISLDEYRDLYKYSVEYLLKEINTDKIILITHFPIHNKGVSKKEYETEENKDIYSYFTNNLLNKFGKFNKISLFGHTHYSVDKVIEGVRFISNPIGYVNEPTYYNKNGVFNLKIEIK